MKEKTWEQRWHPLREEWVIVAAHRSLRPWSGETFAKTESPLESYAPDCYLCPGNRRDSGEINPKYRTTFVFPNDYPPVGGLATTKTSSHGLYLAAPARGCARVACYHPDHSFTLAQMSVQEIEGVITMWQEQYAELAAMPNINHVLIFENKGAVVGVSNPHPHCQIYGTNFIFDNIAREMRASETYMRENDRPLFEAIIAQEIQDEVRIVARNSHAVAFVPYFARYSYEVYIAPTLHHRSVDELGDDERSGFAQILKTVLVKYDNLFNISFPYVLTLHQAPTDNREHKEAYLHIEIHPPLRNPTTLKYLAGPEIGGGNIINPSSPEEKAAELISASDIHFRSDT